MAVKKKKKAGSKKRIVKKGLKAVSGRKRSVRKEGRLEKVGEVTHYFPHVKAAAILVLKDGLKVKDSIYVKGHTTNFKQRLSSMQLDHVPIEEARKAQEIGVLVKSRVRIGDTVYRI